MQENYLEGTNASSLAQHQKEKSQELIDAISSNDFDAADDLARKNIGISAENNNGDHVLYIAMLKATESRDNYDRLARIIEIIAFKGVLEAETISKLKKKITEGILETIVFSYFKSEKKKYEDLYDSKGCRFNNCIEIKQKYEFIEPYLTMAWYLNGTLAQRVGKNYDVFTSMDGYVKVFHRALNFYHWSKSSAPYAREDENKEFVQVQPSDNSNTKLIDLIKLLNDQFKDMACNMNDIVALTEIRRNFQKESSDIERRSRNLKIGGAIVLTSILAGLISLVVAEIISAEICVLLFVISCCPFEMIAMKSDELNKELRGSLTRFEYNSVSIYNMREKSKLSNKGIDAKSRLDLPDPLLIPVVPREMSDSLRYYSEIDLKTHKEQSTVPNMNRPSCQ